MEPLPHGQVRFQVHGPDTATDEVSAGVFAHIHRALLGLGEVFPQSLVFADQFIHEGGKFGKAPRRGEQNLFFRHEMELNFVGIELVDLHLPRTKIDTARSQRPVEAHTERQCVLVLMRKRDQTRVAQHRPIIVDRLDLWSMDGEQILHTQRLFSHGARFCAESSFAKSAHMLNNEQLP